MQFLDICNIFGVEAVVRIKTIAGSLIKLYQLSKNPWGFGLVIHKLIWLITGNNTVIYGYTHRYGY
jgi:hypothetical protein